MTKKEKKYYPSAWEMWMAGPKKLKDIIKNSEDKKEVEIAKEALEKIERGEFIKMY